MNRLSTCLFTALLLALATPPADAGVEFEIGPQLGFSLASVTGADADSLFPLYGTDPDMLVRGLVGVQLALKLSDRWAIQSEIVYAQKAADWLLENTSNNITTTTQITLGLDYFEIPLLARLTVPQAGKVQPFFYAGPALAFHNFGEYRLEVTADSSGLTVFHNLVYYDKIFNARAMLFEGMAGAGAEFAWGPGKLNVEGRYTFSLQRAFEDVPDFNAVPSDEAAIVHQTGAGYELRSNVFSLIIGYRFAFKL